MAWSWKRMSRPKASETTHFGDNDLAMPDDMQAAAALLEEITAQFPGSAACCFEIRADIPAPPAPFAASPAMTDSARQVLARLVSTAVHEAGSGRVRVQFAGPAGPCTSALLVPFYAQNNLCGMLVICLYHGALPEDAPGRIALPAKMLHILMENRHMREAMTTSVRAAQTILKTAHAMSQLPSPQEIVDILTQDVVPPHIIGCAILLGGPLEETVQGRPFTYLDLRGSWTRQQGRGVGSGVRLHMADYGDGLKLLERQRVVALNDFAASETFFDPLVRGLIKIDQVRSIGFFALYAGDQMIGMLVLLSDQKGFFTAAELHTWRMLSEFLSISTVANLLLKERDQVQQLRASLMDAVSDGLVLVLPGARGGHVLSANPVFCQMFGVPPDDASGFTMNDLLSRMILPEDVRRELHYQWVNMPVRSADTHHGEFRLMSGSSQVMDVQWMSAPVYTQGSVMGRVYVFHDVTSERTSMRMRAQFLSRISHELRTPLTSIQGFAEFILEMDGHRLPDLAREYTQIILSSAKQLRFIISEVIELTRIDAGQTHITRELSHLPDVLIDAAARLEVQYRQRHQRMVLALDDDLPPVSIDRGRIVQVVTNLLVNAIKYGPEHSTITMSARLANTYEELPQHAPGDVVLPAAVVEVRDEGAGIPADETENVFMPFFRSDSAKRRKIEGVGLGLPVARSYVEIHQGKIWAVPGSQAGGGLFAFTLPVIREN
jgi:signal transduction histidine kinase